MPADDGIDLAAFKGVEHRLEAGPGLAVERRDVVVVELLDDSPAETLGQRQAVVELTGDTGPLAGRVAADAGVNRGSHTHSIRHTSTTPLLGAVQVIVPSGCCWSRQPLGPDQKVLSKWCFRQRHLRFDGWVGPSG